MPFQPRKLVIIDDRGYGKSKVRKTEVIITRVTVIRVFPSDRSNIRPDK